MTKLIVIVILLVIGLIVYSCYKHNNDSEDSDITPVPTPEPIPTHDEPKVRAITFGWNRVDPAAYNGWLGELPDCEYDATRAAELWSSYGIKTNTLLTKKATRDACYNMLKNVISELDKGDLLIVWISGHGGQTPDYSGDEVDGLDEYVCAYDGSVTDDTINEWLSKVPAGIRILWICDTCHSGTMYKVPAPIFSARAVNNFKGQLILISGSSESNYSMGTGQGGVLSTALYNANPEGKSPKEWYEEAVKTISEDVQDPQYVEYGNVTDDFRNGLIIR